MSAELLLHAYNNTTLYSVYQPIYGSIAGQSLLTQSISADFSKITDQVEFLETLNDSVSKDLYYSIHWCEYEKIYYDDNRVTFYLVGPDVIIVEGTSSLNSKLKIRIIITVVY